MPIKLNNIEDIATIIKTKYGRDLYHMNFIFCFKKNINSYFIFQEIQGMPIKRIVYHKSNNSVTFVASWSAWSNPYSLVADANYDKIENWKDLLDRTRPYNSYIEINGGFNSTYWSSIKKKNKKEKKKKLKTKADTFVEFRIDKIERATFNEWGFEIYSPTINMIGFKSKFNFPYQVVDSNGDAVGGNDYMAVPSAITSPAYPNFDEDDEDYEAVEDVDMVKVTWQGKSFNITTTSITSGNAGSPFIPPNNQGGYDLTSYWDKNENDEENELFDDEIASLILDGKRDESILDIGQRGISLNLDD